MKKTKKQSTGEFLEELDYLGQESEDAAVPYVQEVAKRNEEIETQQQNDALNRLDYKKKGMGYKDALVDETRGIMKHFEIPKGYSWNCYHTKQGIVFMFKTPDGKVFSRGNTVSLAPEIDMRGSLHKIYEMIDTMERMESEKDALIGVK